MRIHVGYEMIYECPQDTPMILTVNIHYSRASDVIAPDFLTSVPAVPVAGYRDGFGNWCTRIVAPAGRIQIRGNGMVRDTGQLDLGGSLCLAARAVQDSAWKETLVFLLGSRYCETDRLSDIAWNYFGQLDPGWPRVQAICDFVHNHIIFGYQDARPTRSAWEAYNERIGVCRDYTHLALTFCRCMNIPARYCTGYLGDMGMPPPYGVGDFAAWIEVYLGGRWHTFDPRNNVARIGRVLIARGRDASDVAIATIFGPATLESFQVWTDEVEEPVDAVAGNVGSRV